MDVQNESTSSIHLRKMDVKRHEDLCIRKTIETSLLDHWVLQSRVDYFSTLDEEFQKLNYPHIASTLSDISEENSR